MTRKVKETVERASMDFAHETSQKRSLKKIKDLEVAPVYFRNII